MTLTDTLGYTAAFLVLLTFSMKTMVPLRIAGIVSNLFFIYYAYLSDAQPILVLHAILLPLNVYRLVQILTLLRDVEEATKSESEPNLDWLQSIATRRSLQTGEVLFRKGDTAKSMYFVMSGSFLVKEIGVELQRGKILGELGLLSSDKTRTQSIECVAEGDILEITYDRVKQLYFQSPKFAFYFLQLASRRLLENNERHERELAAYRAAAAHTARSEPGAGTRR